MPAAASTHSQVRRTQRMTLHPPSAGDLPDLCRLEQDATSMASLLGVRTPDQTAASLDRMAAHWQAHGFGWWIARDRATAAFLGRGGLRRVEVEGRGEVEVGYGFHADHWGRGLATELALESLRFGFDELALDSIISFTLPTNVASRRVMEKCGLQFEGDGCWASLPHVFYRLTRAQWLTLNNRLT